MNRSVNKFANIVPDDHPNLKLTLEDIGMGDAVILRLTGLIDTCNSDFFFIQVARVVEAGARYLIFDVTSTTFMSSTGIGGFTALLKLVNNRSGAILFYGIPRKIFQVFQNLGFSTFFHFFDNREDTVNFVRNQIAVQPSFPLQLDCLVCRRKLNAKKSGRFCCPSCGVLLVVDDFGKVTLN